MKEFENKYPSFWLILGLMLTIFSYGIFNTGICACIFAIPLIRYINIRTKISSIIFMLIGMIIAANVTFFRLVEDDFNIMNQVFCSFNGVRIQFPFFVYFLSVCVAVLEFGTHADCECYGCSRRFVHSNAVCFSRKLHPGGRYTHKNNHECCRIWACCSYHFKHRHVSSREDRQYTAQWAIVFRGRVQYIRCLQFSAVL